MKTRNLFLIFALFTLLIQCKENVKHPEDEEEKISNILFIHHSTGMVIYKGGSDSDTHNKMDVPVWFKNFNEAEGSSYQITELEFPDWEPYGWENYPYDYYNIWVRNAGGQPYLEEPTLEMLTKDYDVIIFKHCYPVGHIMRDLGTPNINSTEKRIENYKLQYEALRIKMHLFPDTKFIVWTGAALLETNTNPEDATRAKEFFNWVKNSWDVQKDNIFIWDFYELETEGGLYLKKEYAMDVEDSHPAISFAKNIAPLFCQRIIDVIENDGENTDLKGVSK